MQRLEVSGAVRPIYGSLGVKRLNRPLLWFQRTQPASPLSANLHKRLTSLLHPNTAYDCVPCISEPQNARVDTVYGSMQ